MLWRCGGGLAAAHGGHGAHGSRATVSGATRPFAQFASSVCADCFFVILSCSYYKTRLGQPSSGRWEEGKEGENPCRPPLLPAAEVPGRCGGDTCWPQLARHLDGQQSSRVRCRCCCQRQLIKIVLPLLPLIVGEEVWPQPVRPLDLGEEVLHCLHSHPALLAPSPRAASRWLRAPHHLPPSSQPSSCPCPAWLSLRD